MGISKWSYFLFGAPYPTPNFPANSHQLNSNSPQENILKKNPTNMPTSTVKRILQKLKSTTKRQTSSSTSSNSDQSKSSKKVINNCPAPSNSSVNNSRAMLSKSPRHYRGLNKLKWNIHTKSFQYQDVSMWSLLLKPHKLQSKIVFALV